MNAQFVCFDLNKVDFWLSTWGLQVVELTYARNLPPLTMTSKRDELLNQLEPLHPI